DVLVRPAHHRLHEQAGAARPGPAGGGSRRHDDVLGQRRGVRRRVQQQREGVHRDAGCGHVHGEGARVHFDGVDLSEHCPGDHVGRRGVWPDHWRKYVAFLCSASDVSDVWLTWNAFAVWDYNLSDRDCAGAEVALNLIDLWG